MNIEKPDERLDIETQIQLVLLDMEQAITQKKGWTPNDYSRQIISLYEPLIEQAKGALDAARGAILDAIYCEDGLDGHTGSVVMEWITDILRDEKEFRPTIEGLSSQTQISEDKAFEHRDKLIEQAKRETAQKIKELAIKAIQDEPEFPSDMPDEVWDAIYGDRQKTDAALKGAVRLTKEEIIKRLQHSLKAECGKRQGKCTT